MYHQWYKFNIDLYYKELKIIKEQIKDYFPYGFKENKDLCITGKVDIDGIYEKILITYPRNYPFSPPKVWLFESNNFEKVKNFREYFHQNYDESLCLFTSDWGEGSWHFNMNSYDVFDKLRVSIRKARNQEHSDEHSSIVNPVPGRIKNDLEIYIPTELLDHILKEEKTSDYIELSEFLTNGQGRILKYPPNHFEENQIFERNSWIYLKPFRNPLRGCYIKLPFNLYDFRDKLGKNNNLIEFLKVYGFTDIGDDLDFLFLLFNDSKLPISRERNPSDFKNMISYLYLLKNSDFQDIYKISLCKVFSVKFPDDIFQRTNAIFEDSIEVLQNKVVLILGLGSLGSSVALELVKTGIKNLVLYDFDIFAPVNICRQIGNIKDIGKYKVNVVEEKIKLKNPEVDIKKKAFNPFERDENLLEFIQDVEKVDLVIDTSASYQANLQLNQILVEFEKIAIYAWCGLNAKSGRVFRVIPKVTPCYYCINLQLEKEPDKFVRLKSKSYGEEIPQFIGYRQPGIPGISIDINYVSLLVSKLTIQTLLKDTKSYPNAISDHYIWQNEPSDLDKYAELKLIPQSEFRIIPRCPVCKPSSKKMFNPQKKREIDMILEKGEKNIKKIRL